MSHIRHTQTPYCIEKPFVTMVDGSTVDLLDPRPDQIKWPAIADGLAKQVRYNGQVSGTYSVAQHCCLVSDLLPTDPTVRLYGLLHDAHEAILGDIITPVKHALLSLGGNNAAQALKVIELRLDEAIYAAAKIPPPTAEIAKQVKTADLAALKLENRDLRGPCLRDWGLDQIPTPKHKKSKPWNWTKASDEFRERLDLYAPGIWFN